IMMTGGAPEGRLRIMSNPPICGICKSRKTRSGCRRAISRRASLPLAASPTISTPEKAASSSRSTSRATGSSSTMRVRSGGAGIIKEWPRRLPVSQEKFMDGQGLARGGRNPLTSGCACLVLWQARRRSGNHAGGVQNESHLRGDVYDSREQRAQDTDGGEGDTQSIDGKRAGEIEQDDAAAAAGDLQEAGAIEEVVAEQENAGGLAGQVGAGAHRDADGCLGQRGGVVDSVAHHGYPLAGTDELLHPG